jgi:RNA polymerase sigma-70 factor (ECF subfamily)
VAIEDVVQMTMINAMRNLDSYRGSAALFTWLCRICRNVLVDARRKAARQPNAQSVEELAAERPLATVVELTEFRDPLDECESDSMRGAVRRVINSLPGHYARILELRFGDELSGQEIARTLEMSESAAESLLARARQAFKSAWKAYLEGNDLVAAPKGGGAL